MNISLGLDAMIESLGMQEQNIKLWSVNDNASNMRVAIRESNYLEELNCAIHTISLAVTDTFKSVQGMKKVLKKAKKLAKYSHSEGPMRQLKSAVEGAGLKFLKPKNPGETRWSSQLDCFGSMRPYKDVFNSLSTESPEWERRNLTKPQWKLLEGAVDNLESFKTTIKAWEGEKEPTIDRVIERVYINHSVLDSFITDPRNQKEKSGLMFAKKLKANLEHRFPAKGTDCLIYGKANYLSPLYKGIHLMAEDKLEEVKSAMETEWNQMQAEVVAEAVGAESVPETVCPLSPTSQLRKKLGTRTEYRKHQKTSPIRKEMERYENFSTAPKTVNILGWWKRMANALPILSEFARSVLAIPASSAKSERVFSRGSNIVTIKRTRLNPKKVEEILVIGENKKKVAAFMQKTTYEVKKTEKNIFAEIDIKEIVRKHEEEEMESEEDSDDGAEVFESEEEEAKSSEEYDSDSDDLTDDEMDA